MTITHSPSPVERAREFRLTLCLCTRRNSHLIERSKSNE
jgi:hypothetical protein